MLCYDIWLQEALLIKLSFYLLLPKCWPAVGKFPSLSIVFKYLGPLELLLSGFLKLPISIFSFLLFKSLSMLSALLSPIMERTLAGVYWFLWPPYDPLSAVVVGGPIACIFK